LGGDSLARMRTFLERGGAWVVGQGVLFVVWAVLLRYRVDLPVWVTALGALIALAGAAEGLAGMRGLGTALTPYPEPSDKAVLVETGVYGLVRHPIYGGVALGAVGLGLALGSPAAAVGVILLGYFRVKAAEEERRLLATFPEYPGYRKRVPAMLVPWIL